MMRSHEADDKVLIVGVDDGAVKTLQAQLELSGLRGRIAVTDDRPVTAGLESSRPALIIWHRFAIGDAAPQLVDRMIADGVPAIAIGADRQKGPPEADAILQSDYTVSSLLETVGRFVDLPRPADVIDMNRARDSLVDEEACYHDLFERASDAILLIDHDTHIILEVNREAETLYGYDRSELIGMSLLHIVPKEEHADIWQNILDLDRSDESTLHIAKRTHSRKDGSRLTVSISTSLLTCRGRRIFQDIVRDETARFARELLLRQILDSAPDPTVVVDADGKIQFVNRQLQAAFGYLPDELIDQPVETLVPERFAARHVRYRDDYRNDPKPREMGSGLELCGQTKDGREIPIEVSLAPVRDHGQRLVAASIRDITERKRAEEELRKSHRQLEERVAERTRELERQQEVLHQAQKMEAIGQLTGGVAHDFNNLLTAILGNLEMLEMWHGGDERSGKAISQAQEAADLGAELTGRLLAFARRQPLDPKAISLSDVVLDMSDLLSRTLGETIEINTVLANPLDNSFVDPVQVQNALLNLCLNARDAMSDGGKLTIETANVTLDQDYARENPDVSAGDYVLLSVTDTGVGMAPEIREHVFEPFFTTKSVGKGSGLGLSMIYGFVKQSEGHIRLYSEVGHGTAISLYFPTIRDTTQIAETHDAEEAAAPRAQGEVVLVVEDEPRVRHVTVQRLETLGYRVLEAENGPAALDLLATSPGVDLLFTDVVMPGGMSGGALAAKVRERYPQMKVMLTSGYAEQAGIEKDAVDEGMIWLRKPYRLIELASKVRDVLDS